MKQKKDETKKKEQKLNKDTALAKIKVLISKYYEDVGRIVFDDVDEMRIELIEAIEDVLNEVEIDTKRIILEKFKLDKEARKGDTINDFYS